MHIAYDSQIFRMQPHGGISKYFIKLIEGIKRLEKNIDISIVAGIHDNEHLLNSGLSYHGVHQNSFKRQLMVNRFYNFSESYNKKLEERFLLNPKIDIIHQTYNGYELVKTAGPQIVITVHDLIYEKYPKEFSDADEFLERKRKSIETANHIICVSKNTQSDLIRHYKVDIGKTTVVHHGVDVYEKQSRRIEKDNYVLFVGKRDGYKNFEGLLKAFSNSKTKQEVKLICFGSGSFNIKEKNLINEFGLDNKVVHQKGSDSDLANLYQHALFFIYPSIYEGFGLPVLEAMANECPVICHNKTSLPEVSNGSALEVDCENTSHLTSAIDKLYSDSGFRKVLSEKGKENVKQFTWEATAMKTLEVYKRVIQKKNS
jgi:glycosyltransferase involved in cell wall biosynthesis